MSVSILILTKNEELDILGCLDSVLWSDDVHVYDSGSSDATLDIAKRYGAKITVKTYVNNELSFGGNEAAHRNWGLKNIEFKYEWVFIIDADERVTPGLRDEILLTIKNPNSNIAYSVQRRDFFMDRWLRHVQTSPYYLRLIKPKNVIYQRLINPVLIVDGPVAKIKGFLDHFPFSKGIQSWIIRHNSYSTLEAQEILKMEKNLSLIKAFFENDFHKRRSYQKSLFYQLPCRPFLKFILLYIFKRGFLDGYPGFTYAILQSIYEYFIILKVGEVKNLKINH